MRVVAGCLIVSLSITMSHMRRLVGFYTSSSERCLMGESRHNQLCRIWSALLRRAGWHVHTEQNIPLLGGDTKRADLVAISPTGNTTVCDLQVTSTSDLTLPTAPTLQAAAQNKARLYSTTPGGSLPDAQRFLPLIHITDRPWMHERTFQSLHEVCHQGALSSCAADSPHWGPHFASHRHLAAAELGHCLATLNCQMHASCGVLLV